MSVASPASIRGTSRSSIEISPELKPRDLNVLLKDVERKGSSELFLYAKEGRVFMTSSHEELLGKRPERSDEMLRLIRESLEKTTHSTNINDVFLDIRKFAKALKPGRHDSGVRKESNYVAVGTRQLSGLLTHKHDPLSQEQRAERKQIIDDALMASLKALHAMCSADAKLEDDDDRAPLLDKTRAIGAQVAETLLQAFRTHNKNCGKHELALFRMSFLVDRDEQLKAPLKQLLSEKCAHRLREDIFAAFSQGLQEAIGNVSTDGKRIATENADDAPLASLRVDGLKLRFADSAGTGAHGSVNIYRSSSDPDWSVAVKSPLSLDGDWLHTLAQCQRELGLHLQAQGIGHENVVEVLGALRLGTQLHIVMEDCSLGALEGFISKRLAGALRENDIDAAAYRLVALTLAHDVLAGLHHLHESSGVLHLDIKPGNVFIGIDGKAKVGDFDRSMKGSAVSCNINQVPDTPQYLSPRLLAAVSRYRSAVNQLGKDEAAALKKTTNKDERKGIIKAARQARDALDMSVTMNRHDDAYAAGVTVFEVLYCTNPFIVEGTGTGTVKRVEAFAEAGKRQRRRLLFDEYPLPAGLRSDEAEIQGLLMQMMDPDEDRRAGLAEALAHPLFADNELGSPEARALIRRIGGLD